MEKCPVCDKGQLITKIGKAGEETYCAGCRRIVVSSALGFVFTAAGDEGVEECKGPEGDPRPGYKGPGPRSKCHLYDPGDEGQKKTALEKAKNAAYAAQHKTTASKIINATAGFTLNNPGYNLIGETNTNSPTTLSNSGNNQNALRAHQGPAREESAAGDVARTMQMGELNGANPLNSGTTASRRLAELIAEDKNNSESTFGEFMGVPLCTSCDTRHVDGECKNNARA